MTQYVFLDTNVLLHFKTFTELDWPSLVGKHPVRLFFAPSVVRELDEKKIAAPTRKVRDRARVVIAKLKEIRGAGSFTINEETVEVSFLSNEPQIDWLAIQLDRMISDDRLLASMLMFAQFENIPHDRLTLVTNDFGLHLKATAHEINTIELPESLALTLIEDPTDLELKKTKGELEKLRFQFPKLDIRFAGGFADVDHRIFSLTQASSPPTESELNDRTKEIETDLLSRVPVVNMPNTTKQTLGDLMGMVAVPPERIKEYKESVALYVKKYPSYLVRQYESRERLSRCVRLDLVLSNSGSAPADDSDVFLHFPDGFDLTNEEPFEVSIPDPPRPPKNMIQEFQDSLLHYRSFPDLSYLTTRSNTPSLPNVSTPQITRTKSFDVRFTVNKIKHNMEIPLDPLWIIFPQFDSARSFGFQYEILTANHPDPFRGELHIIIEKV